MIWNRAQNAWAELQDFLKDPPDQSQIYSAKNSHQEYSLTHIAILSVCFSLFLLAIHHRRDIYALFVRLYQAIFGKNEETED